MAQVFLELECQTRNGRVRRDVVISKLVIAGWTGRDRQSLEHHIEELAALGVARPSGVPMFYELSPALLTGAADIDVVGAYSSGEVEAVLWILSDGIWVGVGSDHTDRKLEAVDMTWSKQVCAKPVSTVVWPLDEVANHWDELCLAATVETNGQQVSYQAGGLAALRQPQDLLGKYAEQAGALPVGSVMFCGTLPLLRDIHYTPRLQLMLEDPILSRRIVHHYSTNQLLHG